MDIRAYLRDMDREEEDLRTQIMRLQIRIQQLNDARLVLMQREEERAQHLGHQSPFGSLDGGHIVVRDRSRMMAPEKREPALPPPAPKQAAPRELPNVPEAVTPPDANPFGVAAVSALLKAEGRPMARAEIVRQIGIKGAEDANRLSKTLANMRHHKYITRDASGYIVLLKEAKGQRKGKKRPKIAKPDPERAAAERRVVLEVLASTTEPLPSGDIIAAVMGPGPKNKATRDRLYWALKALRDNGVVQFRDGLYKIADKAA